MSAQANRSSQQFLIDIGDVAVKEETEPDPTHEVIELRQRNAQLEKDKRSLIRIAGEVQARVDFLENLIDKKPTVTENPDKMLLEEAQKKIDDLTLKLAQYEDGQQRDQPIVQRPSKVPSVTTDKSIAEVSGGVKRRMEDEEGRKVKLSKYVVISSSEEDSEDDPHEESAFLVLCICGQTEDDGEEMVPCDNCIRWEHVDCIFPRTKTAPKGGYLCHACDPRPTELTPTMAREYQERVRKEKLVKHEMEVKRKLQERVAKRKEESSRKSHSISRIISSKGSMKIDKPANSSYRTTEKNEYSASAKLFLTIFRSSGNLSTTPDVINILRDHPKAKRLVVEPNTYGLFTTRPINNGDYIAELCGLVILQKECLNRDAPPGSCNEQTFLIEKDGDKIIIDARKCGNYARYVRRSCKPNAELQVIMCGSELHVMIRAKSEIDAMTEVLIGMESDWRKTLRLTQLCTCKGDELKKCEVELFLSRKGKNMASTSRRSLPDNGTTSISNVVRRREDNKKQKEDVEEEPATSVVQKKEKKPWPKVDYSLPSERNKPSREERKFQAECERIEKDAKKRRDSSAGRRSATVTPR